MEPSEEAVVTSGTHHGVALRERDGVAVVTISRPDRRNALSLDLLGELAATFASLAARPVRAVVVEGAAGCFSAGADLNELQGTLEDLRVDEAVAHAAGSVRALPAPVVAAIEGPCVGAAVELAMACDLRVVSETAFFQLPAVHLGLLYRPGAVADLARSLAPAVLSRLLLFGDRIGAHEAVALGIAAGPVAPASGSTERACSLADGLPAPPSEAVAATKRLLIELAHGGDPAGFEELRRALLTSPARSAALAAARRRLSERRG